MSADLGLANLGGKIFTLTLAPSGHIPSRASTFAFPYFPNKWPWIELLQVSMGALWEHWKHCTHPNQPTLSWLWRVLCLHTVYSVDSGHLNACPTGRQLMGKAGKNRFGTIERRIKGQIKLQDMLKQQKWPCSYQSPKWALLPLPRLCSPCQCFHSPFFCFTKQLARCNPVLNFVVTSQ